MSINPTHSSINVLVDVKVSNVRPCCPQQASSISMSSLGLVVSSSSLPPSPVPSAPASQWCCSCWWVFVSFSWCDTSSGVCVENKYNKKVIPQQKLAVTHSRLQQCYISSLTTKGRNLRGILLRLFSIIISVVVFVFVVVRFFFLTLLEVDSIFSLFCATLLLH